MDKIKGFKEELAALLEKYNCELMAADDGVGCCGCKDLTIEADFGNPINHCSYTLGLYVDPESLRKD